MKQKLIIVLIVVSGLSCSAFLQAQILTVDPVLTGVTIASSALENSSYSTIKSKQTAIEALQASTLVFTSTINKIQTKLYNGLLYVSSTVHNAYQIYDCYTLLKSIYENESKMIAEAQQNPLALIFAVKFQNEMVVKAIAYYRQIAAFILKENDEKLLMDAGERTLLLTTILEDLRAIEAYAVSSYYRVHWAVQDGIIKTLNPFGNFVNKDAQIVQDILRNWKH
ncbi:hypothetical protein [Ferruginibacter sp.]